METVLSWECRCPSVIPTHEEAGGLARDQGQPGLFQGYRVRPCSATTPLHKTVLTGITGKLWEIPLFVDDKPIFLNCET